MILPLGNQKDVEEIPEHLREEIKFVFVDHLNSVLEAALCPDVEEKKKLTKKSKPKTDSGLAA